MPPAAPGRRGSHPLTWAIFFGAIALVIVLFCSGLHFPMWDPAANLNGRLGRDLKLSLPAGARVTNAARVATRDPAAYYRVELPDPAAAAAFVTAVRGAAAAEVEDEDPSQAWGMGPTPDWWKPLDLPGVRRLDIPVSAPHPHGGYRWFHADSSRTLYVFWYAT